MPGEEAREAGGVPMTFPVLRERQIQLAMRGPFLTGVVWDARHWTGPVDLVRLMLEAGR